jgi:hypothetical protein
VENIKFPEKIALMTVLFDEHNVRDFRKNNKCF